MPAPRPGRTREGVRLRASSAGATSATAAGPATCSIAWSTGATTAAIGAGRLLLGHLERVEVDRVRAAGARLRLGAEGVVAEVLGVVRARRRGRPDADVARRAEDVAAVPGARHPAEHDGAGVAVAGRDVLADALRVALGLGAVARRQPLRRRVREVVAAGHVLAVQPRGRVQPRVAAKRREAVARPDLVREAVDGVGDLGAVGRGRGRCLVGAGGARLRGGGRPEGECEGRRRLRPENCASSVP